MADGALGCATCHPIHRGDQGVVFSASERPIRFAPGAEVELEPTAFRPAQRATVAIVTAGSCKGCHDVASPRDPSARCFARGQEALGDARPSACFDEHQVALPEGGAGALGGAARPRAGGGAREARDGGGVCSGQHTEDRAVAWEAAREAAAAVPVVPAASVVAASAPERALAWIGAGLGAAGLVLAGIRGGRRLLTRRKEGAGPPPEALMRPAARVRLPQIDASTCIGCYACVDACPYDVLAIERYVAVVARPEACCGLTLCEQRCPNGSLKITDGAPIGDRPRLGDDLGSADVPGLYLAGDITGLPLIKNAIHQGAQAVTRIAEDLRAAGRAGEGALDLIIVGAGPAGISAALRAKELGLSFEVIEQGSVAQSIQSFPRGKLVFDQPLELPAAGKLWLKESTKEELLSHWLRIVRQERLPIAEGTRMVSARKTGEGFVVTTEPSGAAEGGREARRGAGEGARTERRARRVLLAIGQRGTPRRLSCEVPAEVEARVYYHLADARSLAGKRALIVGLGDVAMEAAIALARQPGTAVTIAYRGSGFRRGQGRNIDEVRRMAAASRVALLFDTEVAGLAAARGGDAGAVAVTLSSAGVAGGPGAAGGAPSAPSEAAPRPAGARTLPFDAVLVLIGSIPPWNTLREAGVRPVLEASGGDRTPPADVQGATPAGGPP
jgi:thioredoxin reductase